MISFGPYAAFIAGSYGLAALVVIALVAWTMRDHRNQTARLRDLEQMGVSRRSRSRESDVA